MDSLTFGEVFLSVLVWLIAFIKAILIPVIPAGVIIAFLVDQVLKRFSFWKDGWAGYASLGLNLLFSAGLFFAAQVGKSEDYLTVLAQLTTLLTLIVSLGVGFAVSYETHKQAMKRGIGKSTTEDAYDARMATYDDDFDDEDEFVGETGESKEEFEDDDPLSRDGPVSE